MTSENNQSQLVPTLSNSPSSLLPCIVSHVAALERGDSIARTSPLQIFPILESEYAQLDNYLEEADLYDFYHDKRFFELVFAKVAARARILEQKYLTIAQRLLKLRSMSTANIDLLSDDGKVGHKSPDVSIGYSDRIYPHAVFEVEYNQDRKALEHLAWDYIMGLSHCIRYVGGSTPDYLQNQSLSSPSLAHNASVSVWRPLVGIEGNIKNMDVKQEIKDQRLRDCNPDHALAVRSIRDLLDDEMLEGISPGSDLAEFEIVNTSGEMIGILASAERCHKSSRRQREKLLRSSQNPSYN
ncbi:hypothetical protein KCU73_g6840, partial [Aureobasidium melanogenum]